MKKTLSLLSILALTGTSGLAVLACKKTDSFDITVQANPKWVNTYQRAIDKLNNEYKQRGLKFRFVIKEIEQSNHIESIEAKGIRDKNIADVFAMPFDNYQKAVQNGWITNLTKEIKNVLIKNDEDTKRFGIKKSGDNIQVESNKEVWENSSHKDDKGIEYGMVPFSVENLVWMFDKKELGIETDKDSKQSYLVGSKLSGVENLDKIKVKNNGKEQEVPAATLENLIKINNKFKSPVAFLAAQNGYFGGAVLNAYVNKEEEKIKSKKADWSTAGLIWANKNTELNSKDYTKFSSLMEDNDFKNDFDYATNELQEMGKSYGDSVIKTMIGKEKDHDLNEKINDLERDGTVKLKLAGPWEVKDTIARMNHNNRNVDFGFVSIGSVTVGKNNSKNKLAGFAGGFGLAVKQTISNQVSQDNDGKKVTKLQAAVEFMKEITKVEYNKELAIADGKISSYKSVLEDVEKEIIKEGSAANKLIIESYKLVWNSLLTTGKDKEFGSKPNTKLFDQYWGPYSTAYGLSMKNGKFGELFKQQYKKAKEKLIKGN
ncbi:hypothetical protein MFERI14815_00677 [Mycoplasma feriruminatoris]|uniref:hypothetical protein n=1 Tax=Mycoplasma feriruminatoris TaxID=1179777 RepID=UPI00241C951D|nr:hypothetical protein [Mycoplasma feriruminatoris]WFQ92061.1 hypothetical protein MFERI14815_00677 [Mycoplasma feriruminatoris]